MIEKIVLDYLNNKLNGVPVVMEQPQTPADKFVLIEKTGSSEADYIQSATLAVQSYDTSLFGAASLNETVKTAMREIITLPQIARCKANGDYNFTDPTTKRYRYQAVFELTYY